jgi:hypothetical protein
MDGSRRPGGALATTARGSPRPSPCRDAPGRVGEQALSLRVLPESEALLAAPALLAACSDLARMVGMPRAKAKARASPTRPRPFGRAAPPPPRGGALLFVLGLFVICSRIICYLFSDYLLFVPGEVRRLSFFSGEGIVLDPQRLRARLTRRGGARPGGASARVPAAAPRAARGAQRALQHAPVRAARRAPQRDAHPPLAGGATYGRRRIVGACAAPPMRVPPPCHRARGGGVFPLSWSSRRVSNVEHFAKTLRQNSAAFERNVCARHTFW